MIFKQFRHEPLAAASYLLGCPRAGEAFVVDPIDALGAQLYVLEAVDLGLTGGSTCGGVNLASSTIGYERRHNLALAQPDAAAFARFVAETARPLPEGYARIKACNLGLLAKAELTAGARP